MAAERSNDSAVDIGDSAIESSEGKRRLKRGARKTLYWIVVVALAVSLPIVTGVGNLFGGHSDPATPYEERAEEIESNLESSPQNPKLLLALSMAYLHAGDEWRKEVPLREEVEEALRNYRKANAAWSKYLGTTDSLDPEAVKQIAPMYLVLAENAPDMAGLRKEVRHAARAYEVLVRQSPSINTLMMLAYYRYSAFERKPAQAAGAEALALATTPAEKEQIKSTLAEYAQRSVEKEAQVKNISKALEARERRAQR